MNIYFAAMEGVTDETYRRLHHAAFPGVDKYFMPFISPTKALHFTARELRALSPDENSGVPAVPQILVRDAEVFLEMARYLADNGYREVNLNLGCPSGTVTAKGKGAGMLRSPDDLRRFLDAVYARAPLPVSIKTRIGYESADEWEALLSIFAAYPLSELIVHPRTRKEFYGGTPHRDLCAAIPQRIQSPFVYNGDLFTAADCRLFLRDYPGVSALMLGRGLVGNPALAREAKGGEGISAEELRRFHDTLFAAYQKTWQPHTVIGHMHEIVKYMAACFEDPRKPLKAMRKAQSIAAYTEAADLLFGDCPLKAAPYFCLPFL